MFNSVVFLNNFIHPYFRQNGFLEKNIKVSVLFKPFQRTHDEREFKVDIVKIKALKDKDTADSISHLANFVVQKSRNKVLGLIKVNPD